MDWLGKWVAVGACREGGVIGVGSSQIVIKDDALWEKYLSTLRILKEKGTDGLKETDFYNDSEVRDFVTCLDLHHFFTKEKFFDSHGRYSRNFLYYGYNGGNSLEIQKRLANSKVTVMGCGGIGTHIAYYLATSGIGEITLIDNDNIELSNLTRQILFTESDIGERKTKILKRELLKRNHEAVVNIIETRLNSMASISALPSSDLYIVSADTPVELIDWINEACVLKRQAYVNVGYINDISVVGPFYVPQETACIKCTSIMPDMASIVPDMDCDKKAKQDITAINQDFRPATFPGVNGVAAACVFTDIIKYLGGFGDVLTKNKRIGIHSASPGIEIQNLYKNKDCPVCGIKQN